MGGSLGLGQMIAGGGARSKDDYVGQGRGFMGGAVSLIEQGAAAAAQAQYQDEMNAYQREMAQHGRPRLSPDEVSTLIHKKDDVVADHMISFVFGREPLLIKPAPFFRPLPAPTPEPELPPLPWHRTRMAYLFTGAILGVLFALNLVDGHNPTPANFLFGIVIFAGIGTTIGDWLYKVREKREP
jgi:hypothetical protein